MNVEIIQSNRFGKHVVAMIYTGLTRQRDGREAVREGRAQRLQVLLQEAVSRAFLQHVSFQTVHGRPHALHVLLQGCVALLIFHVRLSELSQFSLTCWNTHGHDKTRGDVTGALTLDSTHLYCGLGTLRWKWEYQRRSDPLSLDPSERRRERAEGERSDIIYTEKRQRLKLSEICHR